MGVLLWHNCCLSSFLGDFIFNFIHWVDNPALVKISERDRAMDMGQIVGQLKILVLVVGFIALLGARASSEALRGPMSRPLNVSTNSEGEALATFLKDFEFIPGSAVLIEGRYVLALYESSKRQLFTLALFTADRDPEYSTLMEAVTFSLVDAQSEDVQMERVSNDSGGAFYSGEK